MGSDNLPQESLYSGKKAESRRKKNILAAKGTRTRVSIAPGFSVRRSTSWTIPDPHYSPGDLTDLLRPAVLVTSLTSHVLLFWWPHWPLTSCCPGDLSDLSRPAVLVTSLTSHFLSPGDLTDLSLPVSWWPHWPLTSCLLVTSLTSHVLLSWWPHWPLLACCPGDLTDFSHLALLVTSLTSHVLLSWWPHWPLTFCLQETSLTSHFLSPGDLSRLALLVTSLTSYGLLSGWPCWLLTSCSPALLSLLYCTD